MILLIDNFDSFTHLLADALSLVGGEVEVVRNNGVAIYRCLGGEYSHIVVGPGPGRPAGAGATMDVIAACRGIIPILGVCLGMQAIAEVYGGSVVPCKRPLHGMRSVVNHFGAPLFSGLPDRFMATRYHSLVVERESLPPSLVVTALSDDGEVMALRDRHFFVEGVQFHPESILTEQGLAILQNFYENKCCLPWDPNLLIEKVNVARN